MRCSHPERAFTFVFTTLLFILSTTALVESATVHGFHARHAWRKRASIPTGQQITSTPGGLLPTTIPSLSLLPTIPTSPPSISVPTLSLPTPPPLPSIPSPQTSNPTTASSSSDDSTPSPTSVPSTSTTSTTTSQAQVQTTSNGTPLSISSSTSSTSSTSSSSYLSSSQHPSSTTPSTSAAATAGVATPIAQVSITAGYSGPVITTSYSTGTIISSTPSSTSSSNSGFFSNTGAVAGTFTVAGLVGVAGIIGVGMMIARRRASRPYEDDMEYLEKSREPPVELSQSQNFVVGDVEELSDLSHVSQSMEVTVPPAAHLYPQHDVYLAHGHTANESDGFENQGYYPQVAYTPQEYGIAYPPRESFAAEDAYGGLDEARSVMPNPFDNVATEPPAASQHSDQYLRTASPPLTAYLHRSVDSFYGSSAGASQGHAI